MSVAIGYPQITGIVNTNPTDLFNLAISWQKPVNFQYQSYQLFLIVNGTSIIIDNILTENYLLTAANTGGLVQPGTSYIVQVRGFLNGGFGPQSLPVAVSTGAGDLYGPVGTDTTSVNQLQCNYLPQNLNCRWLSGSRLDAWINATFYATCTRKVTPIFGARAYIVQKVLNTLGSTVLPTTAIIPLPSGADCLVLLTVYYGTPVLRVDLSLPGNGAFVNTDKSPRPNTPLVVPPI